MTEPGTVIYQTRDLYGEIQVFDYSDKRTLSFDLRNEQSASLRSNPSLLLYEYTQAMLLSLLFRQPKNILCLGLGAGSLVSALYRHCPNARITAVELRRSVIEIAFKFFTLPQNQRLRINCGDAEDFLTEQPAFYDLILSDLYMGKGVSPVQLESGFLRDCAAQLGDKGLLVLNCWLQQLEDDDFLDNLQIHFPEIWCCYTQSGNGVLFAAKTQLENSPAALKEKARLWSDQLGFSLAPHLARMVRYSHLKRKDRNFITSFQWLQFFQAEAMERATES